MGRITIHSALEDSSAASRFTQGLAEAAREVPGTFVAWLRPAEPGVGVSLHLEEPGRKEAVGNVVETWKRSIHLPLSIDAAAVRSAVKSLLAAGGGRP